MKTRASKATAPRRAFAIGFAFALVSSLVGCADIWGFDDLTRGPDSASDSASPAPTIEDGSMLDAGEADAPPDGSSQTDAALDSSPSDAADARVDASARDGGDGRDAGASNDAASDADADDGATMARCMACAGCCDSQGVCQGGTAVSACGTGGSACLNCPVAKKCTPLMSSCCTSSIGCGCTTAGITACM